MRTDPALVLEVTAAQRTTVEAALRQRDLAPRVRERLEMVKAATLGQDLDAIARWTGRTPETVRRWLAAFQEGGIDALADAPRQGRPQKADAAYLAALEAAVETPPRTLGFPCDVWTSRRLSAYLIQQTGVKWPPVQRRCDWRGKKVRGHPERYELHYEDETHLDTNPYLSRVWHRVGEQPTVPAAGTNRRLTIFGSVEALGRGRIEVLQVRQDSAGFARYLAALDARHQATGRHIILVLDNGPCHTSTATKRALAARG